MINIKRLKSIDSAIQWAMNRTGADNDRNRPLFAAWGIEADREIGSFYNYKRKIKVLDVSCQKEVDLPCDAVAVIGVLSGDQGCDCQKIFRQAFQYYTTGNYTSAFFSFNMFSDSPNGSFTLFTKFEIQDGKLIFLTPVTTAKVTVEYLGYETDDNDLPKISESHVRAVGQYIELQWSLRSKHVPDQRQISRVDIQEMDFEWHRLCRLARADDARPTQTEQAQIVQMFNDPLSGMGAATWRYPDEFYGGFYI